MTKTDEFLTMVRALNARQWTTLAYFADPTRDNLDAMAAFSGASTYTKVALRKRGLLEHCEAWPFMRATEAGVLALAIKEGL